ncbi:hypothetical protein OTU49_010718 [Cherax quadricarinatus]|uniref:Secreted protein n=1 Tax=Cherax quadricarinatus TaxID=27406 RepID=A0AAW0Y4Y6_CHEQU
MSRGCQLLQFIYFIFLGIVVPVIGRLALVQKSAAYSKKNIAYNIATYRHLPLSNISRKVSNIRWNQFHACVECDTHPYLVFEFRPSCHPSRIFLWWQDVYS